MNEERFEKISVSLQDGVMTIALDDPPVLNAIGRPMLEELDRAIDRATREARAILLTGKGRAFCVGANLSGGLGAVADDGLPDAGATLESHTNPLLSKLRALPIPWISAIRGAAAGAGCSFALAADLIVASETAFFVQAFAKVGLVPDGGSSWLLSRAVGRPRAMELMLLGERLPAARALEWGLINRVVPDEMLETAAFDLARILADGPTRALAMIRNLAWEGADSRWEEALARERQMQKLAGRSADHAEGVAAFREKRPPRFTGA